MSKYNSNAGFKNYDVPSEEENQEVVSSPLSKYKTGLIFGGVAFGIIVLIIVILMLVIQNDDLGDDIVEGSSQVEVASYDYDDLFDVEPTDEDGSTISNPYDGINNNNNPQSATKPAVAPAQSSNSSDSSNSSSGNSSANSNNGSNNSGGGSGFRPAQPPVCPLVCRAGAQSFGFCPGDRQRQSGTAGARVPGCGI